MAIMTPEALKAAVKFDLGFARQILRERGGLAGTFFNARRSEGKDLIFGVSFRDPDQHPQDKDEQIDFVKAVFAMARVEWYTQVQGIWMGKAKPSDLQGGLCVRRDPRRVEAICAIAESHAEIVMATQTFTRTEGGTIDQFGPVELESANAGRIIGRMAGLLRPDRISEQAGAAAKAFLDTLRRETGESRATIQ